MTGGDRRPIVTIPFRRGDTRGAAGRADKKCNCKSYKRISSDLGEVGGGRQGQRPLPHQSPRVIKPQPSANPKHQKNTVKLSVRGQATIVDESRVSDQPTIPRTMNSGKNNEGELLYTEQPLRNSSPGPTLQTRRRLRPGTTPCPAPLWANSGPQTFPCDPPPPGNSHAGQDSSHF